MEKLSSYFRVNDEVWGDRLLGLPVEHYELDKKMGRACLRLPAKGIRCSCRTAFAVERDILARVVPSRTSSMGPTSSIPHGKSMLGEDCSL